MSMNLILFIVLPVAGILLGWTIRWVYARFQLSASEQKAERVKQCPVRCVLHPFDYRFAFHFYYPSIFSVIDCKFLEIIFYCIMDEIENQETKTDAHRKARIRSSFFH